VLAHSERPVSTVTRGQLSWFEAIFPRFYPDPVVFRTTVEVYMGSVIKKRRKRMAKKKHRKLLRKTRHQRRNKK
jgi:hypothetical protein